VKIILIFFTLICFSDSLSGQFRYQKTNVNDVISSSSLWLSNSLSIKPMGYNRLIIQLGSSTILGGGSSHLWVYPNIDIGFKLTKNLSITSKSYGFIAGNDSPQVLGAGIQYYYGDKDTLNWSTSIQRTELIGLAYYNMQSLDINISKWVQWNDIILKLGVGGIFYNGQYFKLLDDLPNTFEGEINYFGINLLKSISVFDLGLELKINPERLTMSLFFQKEIF